MAAREMLPALIVGAGPSGLVAALMLARRGQAVRLIDKAREPAAHSRALLVNHHSLDLLDKCGVSGRLIAAGHRVVGLKLTVDGRERARLSLSGLPHRHQFLLIIPQNETEQVLAAAVAEAGVTIERGREFIAMRPTSGGYDVELADGTRVTPSWVIGADGAHSSVRKAMGVAFPGTRQDHAWSLADITAGHGAGDDFIEIILASHAAIIARFPLGAGHHRVISTAGDVLSHLPSQWQVMSVNWQSDFFISYRMVAQRAIGQAVLIGDAAHIHSPAGGRGMNLGIEDAVTLAGVIGAGAGADTAARLKAWEAERLARARYTLALSRRLQSIITSPPMLARFLFPLALRLIGAVAPLKRRALEQLTDLRRSPSQPA